MQKCHSFSELANSMDTGDNPKTLRVSLTKKKLSQLSVAKSHSLYELPVDENALSTRPWRNLPKYFTQAFISTLALVKMSAHAKSGGSIEIMGMLTGKIVGDLIIVMDVYALPVEGTETRVNAQNEAYEFMVQYLDNLKEVKPQDSIVGWYHSHPGYGCWLSGIDVATQSLNQNFQDPYLAIVVDPIRSQSQSKVEIGAFRTFPVGYVEEKHPRGREKARSLPTKSKQGSHDMGAHADQYYSLDIKLFKGPQDDDIVSSILDKSWISGFIQSEECAKNYEQSLAKKIENIKRHAREHTGAENSQPTRYEMLFEKLVALQHEEDRGRSQRLDGSRFITERNHDMADQDSSDYNAARASVELGEDGDEDLEQMRDVDFDSESQIGIEDEEDKRSVHATADDNPTCMTQGSDDILNSMCDPLVDEMCDFEEYKAGHSVQGLQQKGTKRIMRTSSEDSKTDMLYGTDAREQRKRFAGGDFGSTASNELRHKMQTLQIELQGHVKETKEIGQAELMRLASRRAQQRVFGQQTAN